jgi:hypothetical protein
MMLKHLPSKLINKDSTQLSLSLPFSLILKVNQGPNKTNADQANSCNGSGNNGSLIYSSLAILVINR